MANKNDFPGIFRKTSQKQEENAIGEALEVLTGQRGSGENRALVDLRLSPCNGIIQLIMDMLMQKYTVVKLMFFQQR